jgi:hypothetical protein
MEIHTYSKETIPPFTLPYNLDITIGCGFGCEFVPVGTGMGLILNPTVFSRGYENVVPVLANPYTRVCVCVDCRAHAFQFIATTKALSERSQSNDIEEDYRRQGTRRTFG